jgi:hypothetical protein
MMRRPALWRASLIALLPVGVILVGCGTGAQNLEARRLESVSILSKTAPLGDRLLQRSEINAASDADAVRTFLQLWSLLQFQSWDQAEQLFEPGLRSLISPPLLAAAFETDTSVWQATRPRIVSAKSSPGTATITFLARNEQGDVMPTAISFGGAPESWRVSYFGLLNPAIARAAQFRTQVQLDPLATKPSPEAVRQAYSAASLQGIYLERKFAGTGTARKP